MRQGLYLYAVQYVTKVLIYKAYRKLATPSEPWLRSEGRAGLLALELALGLALLFLLLWLANRIVRIANVPRLDVGAEIKPTEFGFVPFGECIRVTNYTNKIEGEATGCLPFFQGALSCLGHRRQRDWGLS